MPINQIRGLRWSRRANSESPPLAFRSFPSEVELTAFPPVEVGEPVGVPGVLVPDGEAVGVMPAVGVGCTGVGVGVGRAGVGVGVGRAGVGCTGGTGVLRGPGLFATGVVEAGVIVMETAACWPLSISRARIWCGPADQFAPRPSQRFTVKRPLASACTLAGWPC